MARKINPARKNKKRARPLHAKQSFIAHVRELRRRVMIIAAAVAIFCGVGFVLLDEITDLLLRPANQQQFIYTSPGGGFDFNFRIILYTGLALSVPVFVYQLFKFLEPLLRRHSRRFIFRATLLSCFLAICGLLFGYFVSLPAALNFLLRQFETDQISALLTIQEYMSFVLIYLVGFALLFQIPLIMLFFNRIKPLKPRRLFGFQRYVVLIAFVLGAILSPTADIINQAIMAGPIIVMYQFGIVLVWFHNHRSKVTKIEALRKADEERRQERLRQAHTLKLSTPPAATTKATPAAPVAAQPTPIRTAVSRPSSKYAQMVAPRGRLTYSGSAQNNLVQ